MNRNIIRWTLALTLGSLTAWAQTPIDEKRPANAEVRIEIKNVKGSVRVEAWDEAAIHVTGTLGKNSERLEFECDGDDAQIEVVIPKKARNVGSTELHIRAPRNSSLEIGSVSGSIEVKDITGPQELRTVSGSVRVTGGSGEIEAGTTSGSVHLEGLFTRVRAASVSGSVTVREVRAEVEASTVSGRIQVEGGGVTRAKCEAVSGGVEFSGSLADNARIELTTHSGSVNVSVPATTSAHLKASTFSGSIRNELSSAVAERPRYGPGATLETTVGGGSGRIEARTFSGSVNFRKL